MQRAISPLSDASSLRQWVALIKQLRPEVVVGSTPKAGLLSMVAARIAGAPIRIFQARGARWDGMSGRSASLLRAADRVAAFAATDVVAVSNSLADLFLASKITRSRPIVLGPGGSKGADLKRFTVVDRPLDQPPTMGFAGRLAIDKGISDLVECFGRCRQQIPNLQLLVVGDLDASQPIPARLQQALRSGGIERRPFTKQIETQLQRMDVLVLPSVREGLPNIVMEAAACGVPTAAYNVTGVKDAVAPGITGELAPIGNVQALSDAAVRLLRNPPAPFTLRTYAEQNFDSTKVTARFIDYLDRRIKVEH